MKKMINMFAIVVMVCACAAASADAASVSKIGTINMQRILAESKAGKEARASFQRDVEQKRAQVQAKEQQAKQLDDNLKANAVKMKPQQRTESEQALADAAKELKRLREDLEGDLRKTDRELTARLAKDILGIVQKLGQEQGYTVILQVGPQTVYFDKTSDVTGEVIKRFDAVQR